MNRPIAIATIGTIIGIIWGLYLNTSAILIFLVLATIFFYVQNFIHSRDRFLTCSKILKGCINQNISRYIRVILKKKIIILLICSAIISCFYTKFRNSLYDSVKEKDIQLTGIIQSSYTQNKYSYSYKIRINTKLYILYVKPKKTIKEFEYGDIVKIIGNIELPEDSRNYQGFSQKDYYKAKNIYGKIYASSIEKTGHKSSIGELANILRNIIKNKIQSNLSEINSNILLGILIGDKNEIPDDKMEEFRDSSLIHILCVSRCTYRLYSDVD